MVAGVAVLWGGAGYLMTKPTDPHDYRTTTVQSAQSAYDAVATARLAVRAKLDRRVLGPYVTSVLDDSRDALAGAAKQLTGEAPADPAGAALRDRLHTLLTAADAGLGDLQRATDDRDDAALRSALDALGPVADSLADFVEEHR